MIGIDTNVLVRYIAQDDPAQAHAATAFLEGELTPDRPGWISRVVLVELAWVLESVYDVPAARVAETLETLFCTDVLRIDDIGTAWQALVAYRQGFDFADALIVASSRNAGCNEVVTFDRSASRLDDARLLDASADKG